MHEGQEPWPAAPQRMKSAGNPSPISSGSRRESKRSGWSNMFTGS